MAVCDADYIFTLVDIGAFGSQSDGEIFKESTFGQALESGTIKLPAAITKYKYYVSYYFVGDEAFPLKSYILRPYPGKNLNSEKRIFNYRLSRARRTIENAFGILVSRWQILLNNIIADVETVEKIVAATVCLHNFLCISEQDMQEKVYCPPSFIDNVNCSDGSITPGLFRDDCVNSFEKVERLGSNNAPIV